MKSIPLQGMHLRISHLRRMAFFAVFAVMLLLPQWAKAGWDHSGFYEIDNCYYTNGDDPRITWRSILFNDNGYDEGYFNENGAGYGLAVNIRVGNDGWQYAGHLDCDKNGYDRKHWDYQNFAYGGWWSYTYDEGHADGGKVTWICPTWHIPFDLRNSRIGLWVSGRWTEWRAFKNYINCSKEVYLDCPFTYTIRQINWNGDFTVTPDGTITVPYYFSGSGNTDGRTHICTSINGIYNATINLKYPNSSYSNSSYTFKLSDIGMNVRSSFSIEPYHEYTHQRDRDAGYGVKNYVTFAGAKRFLPMPVATIKSAVFNQASRTVTLNWKPDNENYLNNNGGQWAIYRNGKRIATVSQAQTSYTDTSFNNESNETYTIYYLWKGWNADTKLNLLKSNDFTVSTNRTVPLYDFLAVSANDRVVFTWNSDGYEEDWGNKFNIYIDNEPTPIYTITPTDMQTQFRWEHRSTDKHTDRQNGKAGDTLYMEEPLNACTPHDYRVEGVIDGKVFSQKPVSKKAIGDGTLFYSFNATKGSYPGTVKLSWHVNQQGNTDSKTYILERRRAEKEKENWVTLYRTASADDYLFYTDDTPLPGEYYDYRVTVIDKCPDGTEVTNETTDIGFAQTTGTMSGRITFGATGSSVANVDVVARKTSATDTDNGQFHAMRFTEALGYVSWTYPSRNYADDRFNTGDFSIQMWVNPEELTDAKIVRLNGEDCALGMNTEGKLVLVSGSETYTFDNTVLTAGQYNHVVLSLNGKQLTASVVGSKEDGNAVLNSSTLTLNGELALDQAERMTLGHFKGYVDEFRIWLKSLTESEILENYDHLLVGNEKKLETYWTFDEGLGTQFFDYSRDGSVYHEHHGRIYNNAQPSNVTAERLLLKAKTDTDGNYLIQGVPFAGEGTTYAIIPQLGIHQFNPTQQLRYVGNNSLVHNGTDFTDISSFPVRGKIRYAGTDYPVEGVQFFVDGQICAKEGEPITTNSYGEYEISVPIGSHYITVAKQGHEFADGGRYPADPNKTGLLKNFNDAVSNLDFEDITLVPVAGRIVGGSIEEAKPLGFGLSKNNIGQATITLSIDRYRLNVNRVVEGTTVEYQNNPNDVTVDSPTGDVQSWAVRKGGDADDVKTVTIKTDPLTGEFAALLPPLEYRVKSIEIESNQKVTFDNLSILNASDPTKLKSDTIVLEDGTEKFFEYADKLVKAYYTEPVLEVAQQGRSDGSFGERTYTYSDKVTPETEVPLYSVTEDSLKYAFGYPLFKQENTYIFNVRGYETYVNYDDPSNPVTDEVPLQGVDVTFVNQMGTGQQVVIDPTKTEEDDERGDLGQTAPDVVQLDNEGKAKYEWMAGLPNITAPYTLSLGATFSRNGRTYTWSGINAANSLAGVVTGALPSGNNFVTVGPEYPTIILRDPAGSASQAYIEAGATLTSTWSSEHYVGDEVETMTHTEIGFELTQFNGVGVGAISGIITNTREMMTVDFGVTTEVTSTDSKTMSISTTTTKRISTSDQPEYVGAQGDVFIGNSTNIVFGNARTVGLKKGENGFTLEAMNNYVTGTEFKTTFNYTQNYIENVMIPQYISFRNDILQKGYDENGLIYSTELEVDNEHYGDSGTYTCTKPLNATQPFYTDMVNYYNQQIRNWKHCLALNEQAKVEAIKNRLLFLDGNQSFDSGTFIESSTSNTFSAGRSYTTSFDNHIVLGEGTDFDIFGATMNVNCQTTISWGKTETTESNMEHTITTGYLLMETGDDDALSVDVYHAPDGMGAIFVTRGGQTTCPFEGELRTKYFEPGEHVLSAATMQIEVPKIAVENAANRLSGVPAGKKASYNLLLTNESETGEDCYFSLFAIDETNKKGAKLSINGDAFGNGRLVLVPAGGTVRMNLQLEQNPLGELTYDSIAIVLASPCQSDPASTWDVIGDTVYISAEFVPTSTDVALRIDNAVVNTSTKGILPLSVRGYDPDYEGLKYIAVQYQGVGETSWHNARKYVMNEQAIQNPNEEVLPKSGLINLNFDMTNSVVYPDRTYKFRAISARAYDKSEVTCVSDEILVVKDMSRPKSLGLPNPTDGILTTGDELSVLFNEDILNGELTKDANFRITGILNGSKVSHNSALEVAANTIAAQTDAAINLSGKDFSIDMWLKAESTGELLSHGKGKQKLTVGIDAENHLVIGIGNETYTSLYTVPMNEWSFLTLSLSQEGKLNASVANAANTTVLFKDKEVLTYDGNGPLTIGADQAAHFAIHELLLWEEAHDMATALQQRSITKCPATHGLIGYWKMDEGEGELLTDYARNRHMTLPAETWHIENENIAVELSNGKYLAVPTATIAPMSHDDYAVELWVKAAAQQSDAQLLQMGKVGIVLTANGQLRLENDNAQVALAKSLVADNRWHHIALSVLRNGNANLCVDGESKVSVSADKLGAPDSDSLFIGARRNWQDSQNGKILSHYDRPLIAAIDEVRIWNATVHTAQLKRQRKLRLTGAEAGLVAYYPMEIKTLDSQNQVITLGNAADLCGNGVLNIETSQFTNMAPALRIKPEEENVSFNFTASDNKIVIELNEEAARIEGTTLNFTVRNIHDKNGNLSEPISWSVFVNQNPLAWSETALNLNQQVTEESTLSASLVNKSGKAQIWTLSGLPQWLSADVDYGQLQPLGEQVIHFIVSEATPIGKYEVTAYATGNDGIEAPLSLNITVTGVLPDWKVNMHDYESSMNVIGLLKKDEVFWTDADDILAAFIGEECRGVAQLEYNERYGNYYFTMDIYNNNSNKTQEINFRAYDASTGIIYPVVKLESGSSITFQSNVLLGTYATPKVFCVQDLLEQRLELKAGWNWISFNVQAEDMTIPAIFKGIEEDVITVKSQQDHLSFKNGIWNGDLVSDLSNTEMYSVNMKADRTLRIVGKQVSPTITVYEDWNWLGYYAQQVASIGDALAGLEKTNGDILIAQRGIAYWDEYEWSGSLQMMQPGLGYQLKRQSTKEVNFSYPVHSVTTGERLAQNYRRVQPTTESQSFSPINFRLYPDNAIMTALVVVNGKVVGNAELAVFAGDECRTVATTNAEGIAFLNIPGDEDCELSFKVAVDGQIMDATLALTYQTDAIFGTPTHPMLIEFGNTTGIVDLENDTTDMVIYDLTGRKVSNDESINGKLKGVYIINGEKKSAK
ncbi:MAG: hypothetical protein IJS20_00085 [Bacteroidales bacterium]|nr:hypothetical protein [Bacteroidales bacterium]